MRPAVRSAERVTDTERHVAEITERGYTVVHGVLAQEIGRASCRERV